MLMQCSTELKLVKPLTLGLVGHHHLVVQKMQQICPGILLLGGKSVDFS